MSGHYIQWILTDEMVYRYRSGARLSDFTTNYVISYSGVTEFSTSGSMRARVYPITFMVFLWAYHKYFTLLIISYTESCLFLPRTGSLSLARPSFSTGTALQFPTYCSHLFTSASRTSFLFSHLYSNIRLRRFFVEPVTSHAIRVSELDYLTTPVKRAENPVNLFLLDPDLFNQLFQRQRPLG